MARATSLLRERRGPKNARDPFRAYGAFVEDEADGSGSTVPVATILLTNRECPWRCVFCDLWKDTLDETVPAGAIEHQIRAALAVLPPARWIKLYNAGSFFDPHAIPPGDIPGIAAALAGFERVIVECHPALVGDAALRLRDLLRGRLEVAMGLEIANASVLARLEKGMTLEDFARAANLLQSGGIDLRAFVLVQPPFVAAEEAVAEALQSLAFAEACGASVCSLIPTRPGPRLETLEAAFDQGLCASCFPARRERLIRQNRAQRVEPRVECREHA